MDRPPEEMLRRILAEARVIAVVGASRHPDKDAHTVPAYLQQQGYRIIPVNPNVDEIFGERAYASLADLPSSLAEQVDVALLFRPGDQVGPHVESALQAGVPVIWMQSGIRNDGWARKAEERGAVVVQDLCMRTVHMLLLGPS